MIVAAHPPSLLPSLSYLDKLAKADLFVVMDDLPFEAHRDQNRQRIKVANGADWLVVPVMSAGTRGERVCATRIDPEASWRRRTWLAIEASYGAAPYFVRYADALREALSQRWDRLIELDLHLLDLARTWLRIHVPIVRATSLGVAGTGTARVIELCRKLGASAYLCGSDAEASLDAETIGRAGIGVVWQHFDHPQHAQRFPELGFLPHLGFIDVILNCGPDARELVFSASHPLRARA